MKKVLIIAAACCLFETGVLAQLRSLSGSFGYAQQYAEDLVGNGLWYSRTSSPSLDLSASGILLTEDLAEFELQSSFTKSSVSVRGSALPLDFGTQNWTLYRLSLSVLQYSPLWILYNAREGYAKSNVDYPLEGGATGKTRSRDQSLTLSLRRIPFLPPIMVGYSRSRSWTVEGLGSGALSQSYTFSTSASNGSTTLNLSGQTSLTESDQDDSRRKTSSVRIDGTKSFGDAHTASFSSEYDWYDQFALVRAGLLYRGLLETNTTLNGGINFSQTASALALTTIYSANAALGHAIDEHWRYTLSLGDDYNTQRLSGADLPLPSASSNGIRISTGLSHARIFNGHTVNNALTLGTQWTSNGINSSTYSATLSNSYQKGFGSSRLTATQGTSVIYDRRIGKNQTQVSNRLDLTVYSQLSPRVANTAKFSFNANSSKGTFLGEYINRTISASEGLRGNFMYVIPFSASASVSSFWYFGDLRGTTYAWNIDAVSGRFFVEGLSFAYHYSRNYEIFYHNVSSSHALQLQYSWRRISVSLSAYQRTSYSRQRGLNLFVSRPF